MAAAFFAAAQFECRRNQRAHDLLEGRPPAFARGALGQHTESPLGQRVDAAREDRAIELFLRLEVVMHERKLDARLGRDRAQRRAVITAPREMALGDVEDALLGLMRRHERGPARAITVLIERLFKIIVNVRDSRYRFRNVPHRRPTKPTIRSTVRTGPPASGTQGRKTACQKRSRVPSWPPLSRPPGSSPRPPAPRRRSR